MTRYVSYLDKPYKKRAFCNVEKWCDNKKCLFKLKPADFRKLQRVNWRWRMDWKDYEDCPNWEPTVSKLDLKSRQMTIAQWRIKHGTY